MAPDAYTHKKRILVKVWCVFFLSSHLFISGGLWIWMDSHTERMHKHFGIVWCINNGCGCVSVSRKPFLSSALKSCILFSPNGLCSVLHTETWHILLAGRITAVRKKEVEKKNKINGNVFDPSPISVYLNGRSNIWGKTRVEKTRLFFCE